MKWWRKLVRGPRYHRLVDELTDALQKGEHERAAETAERILDRHADRLEAEPELRERLANDLIGQIDAYKAAQERIMSQIFE